MTETTTVRVIAGPDRETLHFEYLTGDFHAAHRSSEELMDLAETETHNLGIKDVHSVEVLNE